MVELLPVNGFAGTHNWGYDGVLWFAVQESYGGPRAYQRFVDACHQRGIAVIQDVVYNHLGKGGNYLPRYGPYINDEGPQSTWGESINLDGADSGEVRRYILDNVVMWLRDYHVDGLRLDAVHALVDTHAVHLLEEIAIEVDALAAHVRRPLTLIAESDLNDPKLIMPREVGGYGLGAQWNDDFHHVIHVALTGETDGYYADFGPMSAIAKVMTDAFFHDGTFSSFRGRDHGRPVDTLRDAQLAVHRLFAGPRPGRQPGDRRPADRDPVAGGSGHRRGAGADRPVHPDAVHGRGVGGVHAVGVLHLAPRRPSWARPPARAGWRSSRRMGWDPNLVPDPQASPPSPIPSSTGGSR